MADIISVKERLKNLDTPYYFYDLDLLDTTLNQVKKYGLSKGFKVHYAMKANANEAVTVTIKNYGLGADVVSGNELTEAVRVGFPADQIVFAGVGKTDREIAAGLHHNIFSFNCESAQEVEVINKLAGEMNKKASIALRINPNVDAKTHHYITTGMKENKFGLPPAEIDQVLTRLPHLRHIQLTGIHFHIGSQITSMESYIQLCQRANDFNAYFASCGVALEHINVGGGLGINYSDPTGHPVPDFKSYFEIFEKNIRLRPGQELHFELGRAIAGQCGTLISRVLYTKQGETTHFLIIDAGMTELLRPALYQAEHFIENITSTSLVTEVYDVVGPICESSDTLRRGISLRQSQRGDLLAIRSAGAYGEVMSSSYNLRSRVSTHADRSIKHF